MSEEAIKNNAAKMLFSELLDRAVAHGIISEAHPDSKHSRYAIKKTAHYVYMSQFAEPGVNDYLLSIHIRRLRAGPIMLLQRCKRRREARKLTGNT